MKEKVNRVLEAGLVFLFAGSVINVLYQVFTRFILRQASSYTEELARFLLIWIGLLGSSYAAGKKMHLAMDFLLTRLPPKRAIQAEIFVQTMILIFAALVMVYGGMRLVFLSLRLGQISSALRFKMGYVYLALPLSGLLIAFFSLAMVIENFQALKSQTKKS